METLLTTIFAAVAAFAATNLDDIVLLTVYFAQTDTTFRKWHVVLGQYLGFMAILFVSAFGLLGALIIPETWIGLLGFLPLSMGVRRLLRTPEPASETKEIVIPEARQTSRLATFFSPFTFSVASLTFANGADNISIYIPLFAATDISRVGITIIVFGVLIAVWCYLGYRFSRLPALAYVVKRYEHVLVPILLIALGIYIILESNTLSLLEQIVPR